MSMESDGEISEPVTNWDRPEPPWKDESTTDYRVVEDACQFCGDPVGCDGRCEEHVVKQQDAVEQRIRELEDSRKALESVVRESDPEVDGWLEGMIMSIRKDHAMSLGVSLGESEE